MFTFAVCCRASVVCLSVTVVHPTQVVKFSAMFVRHLVPWPSLDVHGKFYGDPSHWGGVKRKRVAKIAILDTYRRLYLGNGAR